MDQDKKMTEMILNHTLEIIRLLTGENVSKSLKLSELNMDKKMILNHSLEIIHLLTGEVPIKCGDVAVYFSMDEWEYIEGHKELYMDVMMESHQDLDIPGLAGAQDGNHLEAVSVKEEEEDTREESNVEATEDLCVRSQLEAPEQEISDNIRTGRVTVKPAIVSNMERGEEPYVRGHQEVKEEEMDRDPNGDGPGTRSILGVHNITISSPDCVMEGSGVSHGCPGANAMNKNLNPSIVPQERLHTGESPRVLSDCGGGSTRDKVYGKDQITEETLICSVCGKCFPSHSELLNHKRVHKEEKPFACPECGKCFVCNSHLIIHKRVHTGERPFACSECGKCFAQNSNLVKHKQFHTGEKTFACSECGKSFVSNSDLVIHKRIHTGEKPFACLECGKCFACKSRLVKHKRVHTGERPYACPECGKCFPQNSHLVQHKQVHTAEKPFPCSDCGKSFAINSALVKHRRVHTGERPFACSECEKCFTSNKDLEQHKRVHTGEKPFVCSECGKCFSRNSLLIEHKRVHTGERPFPCSECGKCFKQKGHLLKHQKYHT